jgi:hypothetical protein
MMGDKEIKMLITGIILILLASIVRGWGALNLRRGPIEAAPIASGSFLAIFSTLSIIVGLAGAILIGMETSFWIGALVFIAFWFFSGIWMPILAAIGL